MIIRIILKQIIPTTYPQVVIVLNYVYQTWVKIPEAFLFEIGDALITDLFEKDIILYNFDQTETNRGITI